MQTTSTSFGSASIGRALYTGHVLAEVDAMRRAGAHVSLAGVIARLPACNAELLADVFLELCCRELIFPPAPEARP